MTCLLGVHISFVGLRHVDRTIYDNGENSGDSRSHGLQEHIVPEAGHERD
jgi:hypothetical protein